MSKEKLLQCPFCGGEEFSTSSCYHYNTVLCKKCHTECIFPDLKKDGFNQTWNTRTPSLDWIVNRAVELGRKRDKIVNVWDAGSYYTSEEILEQIKKELGEKL